mmetsp:Transcript_19790/g.27820  ORF Transcript_19790/g.27820 Transcript_19790/m.27820 type:complete len:506 (+) Transcript_19790:39-1556(+)
MSLDDEQDEEIIERQLAELEFVRSAYNAEEAWIVSSNENYSTDTTGKNAGRDVKASQLERCHRKGTMNKVHRLLNLPSQTVNQDSVSLHSPISIELVISMPARYPICHSSVLIIDAFVRTVFNNVGEGQLANAVSESFDANSWRKHAMDALPSLLQTLRSEAMSCAGEEALYSIFSKAEEWVDLEWKKILLPSFTQTCGERSELKHILKEENIFLARKLIYSHHIIAKSKRKAISDLSRDYSLGGYAKIGWPGIIIIEGEESKCDLFIHEIRRMRWQHLVVRGEEKVAIDENTGKTLDEMRCFPIKMVELGEDQMSELAELCLEAGLEALFKTSMKIYQDEKNNEEKLLCLKNEQNSYGIMVHIDHMNDHKGYEKWLHKACKGAGCYDPIIFLSGDIYDNKRKNIIICIFGDKGNVKKIMKRWRSSRVDVDSKGIPCLERMMSVVFEGSANNTDYLEEAMRGVNELNMKENSIFELSKAKDILFSIGGPTWQDAVQHFLLDVKRL